MELPSLGEHLFGDVNSDNTRRPGRKGARHPSDSASDFKNPIYRQDSVARDLEQMVEVGFTLVPELLAGGTPVIDFVVDEEKGILTSPRIPEPRHVPRVGTAHGRSLDPPSSRMGSKA